MQKPLAYGHWRRGESTRKTEDERRPASTVRSRFFPLAARPAGEKGPPGSPHGAATGRPSLGRGVTESSRPFRRGGRMSSRSACREEPDAPAAENSSPAEARQP